MTLNGAMISRNYDITFISMRKFAILTSRAISGNIKYTFLVDFPVGLLCDFSRRFILPVGLLC